MNAVISLRVRWAFRPSRLARQFRAQLAAAPVALDPTPHVVIDNVFPRDVYRALVRGLPPVECFSTEDRIKQNVKLSRLADTAPPRTSLTWPLVETMWMSDVVMPAIMERFQPFLRDHYRRVFGDELAEDAARARHTIRGRLMLRRPGYNLVPHRDPLAIAMTTLLYVARPGDSEAHGTQLYRVEPESDPDHSSTFYPPPEHCTKVVEVGFRPNTMLVFVNSRGAHAASIPSSAPQDLERYAYQCYIRLPDETLVEFLRRLSPDALERWRGKYANKLERAAHNIQAV